MVLVLIWSLLTTSVGARRDFDAMRHRRKRAAQLFRRGRTQAEVAQELGVSRQSVSRWYADWSTGGAKAMDGAGRAGRMARLDSSQLRAIERALKQGPGAHGYPTQLWTLRRVAEVIESTTGVSYHPGHVWKILRQIGWSRQRPARRAVERDDEAIARWVKQEWPRVKKTNPLRNAVGRAGVRPTSRAASGSVRRPGQVESNVALEHVVDVRHACHDDAIAQEGGLCLPDNLQAISGRRRRGPGGGPALPPAN